MVDAYKYIVPYPLSFRMRMYYSCSVNTLRVKYIYIDTGNLTPSGKRKEWNCIDDIPDGEKPEGGCRLNNLPICPIPSSNNHIYVTLGGGGLFVAKLGTSTDIFLCCVHKCKCLFYEIDDIDIPLSSYLYFHFHQ